MKILIVAALIVKDAKILIARRKHRDFDGFWEFPGGKKEPGESEAECLTREIKEELSLDICVQSYFMSVDYSYDKFDVRIKFYFASIVKEDYQLKVHSEVEFVRTNQLNRFKFLPSNIVVVKRLQFFSELEM
jgi:8-oxo-dGTP diphosphatase